MDIFGLLRQNADRAAAESMAAYMKNICAFLGIPKPKRAELSKPFLKEAKKQVAVDWDFINKCGESEREFQYLALEYLRMKAELLSIDDIPRLRQFILIKPWWDTVDIMDGIIGDIAAKDPAVNYVLLEWSACGDIWLRRIAIDHQLLRKDKTDAKLLKKILVNNLGRKEFFINKAIGWSLREYAKTNPEWVCGFISEYKDKLSPFSIREATKRMENRPL